MRYLGCEVLIDLGEVGGLVEGGGELQLDTLLTVQKGHCVCDVGDVLELGCAGVRLGVVLGESTPLQVACQVVVGEGRADLSSLAVL